MNRVFVSDVWGRGVKMLKGDVSSDVKNDILGKNHEKQVSDIKKGILKKHFFANHYFNLINIKHYNIITLYEVQKYS